MERGKVGEERSGREMNGELWDGIRGMREGKNRYKKGGERGI